jgi:hypothetical protein
MACKFLEIGPGQNLFISGKRLLMQWSVSHGKVTKVYGDIMASGIMSMVETSHKNYLFVLDSSGH